MSAFEQLLARKKSDAGGGKGYMSVALQVTDFDVQNAPHRVYGHPIMPNGTPDQSRTLAVTLRPETKQRTNKRPEITDLLDPSHKSHTQVGGIIVFNYVWEDHNNPGLLTAGWMDMVSHVPGETAIRQAYATVFFKQGDQQSPGRFGISYVKPEESRLCRSMQELEQSLVAMLEPHSPGSHMQAIVRLVSHSGDAVCWRAMTKWQRQPGQEWKQPASGAESARVFIEEQKQTGVWELIEQALAGNEIRTLEVIPGGGVNAGAHTRNKILDDPRRLESYRQQYRDAENRPLYQRVWVGVRAHEDGSPYLTYLQPVSSKQPALQIQDIPTPHYENPALVKLEAAMQAAADATAPASTQPASPGAAAPAASGSAAPGFPETAAAPSAVPTPPTVPAAGPAQSQPASGAPTVSAPPMPGPVDSPPTPAMPAGAEVPAQGAPAPDVVPAVAAPAGPVTPASPPPAAVSAEGAENVSVPPAAEPSPVNRIPEQYPSGAVPGAEQTPESATPSATPPTAEETFTLSQQDLEALNKMAPGL